MARGGDLEQLWMLLDDIERLAKRGWFHRITDAVAEERYRLSLAVPQGGRRLEHGRRTHGND